MCQLIVAHRDVFQYFSVDLPPLVRLEDTIYDDRLPDENDEID